MRTKTRQKLDEAQREKGKVYLGPQPEKPRKQAGTLGEVFEQTLEDTPRARFGKMTKRFGRAEARTPEARLTAAITKILKEVEQVRRETRAHDEEIARVGEETRRLIAEMQRELNLAPKAA
jgi:hypothetical protein